MAKKTNQSAKKSTNKNSVYEPRWLIWTLVISLVVLVGLATYITYGNIYDNLDSSTIVHHPKPVDEQGKVIMPGVAGNGKTVSSAPIKNLKTY
jgi:hypothetical protein